MEVSKYMLAGVIILVFVVSFAAGSMFAGGLPTIDATGRTTQNLQSQPSGEVSDELTITPSGGGGFSERYGYFMQNPNVIYLTAVGKTPLDIYVDGQLEKSCSSSPCEHNENYPEGVHVYNVYSSGLVTGPKFFVIGKNTHENVGDECRNPTLDFSKDGYVDVNDMQKISEVIATGASCPGLTSDKDPGDMNKDRTLNNQDMILLAEKVNSCFK